jgi:hypothetical protein
MRLLIKQLVYFLFVFYTRTKLKNKIRKILKSLHPLKQLSADNLAEHKNIWRSLGSKSNIKWYKVYASINGIDSPEYISEIDYYNKVELILNNRAFSEAYCDKNSYHRYIDCTILPDIYLRNIHGVYYTSNYTVINGFDSVDDYIPGRYDKFIVKSAVDSGGGKGVELFRKIDNHYMNSKGIILTKNYLEKTFRRNFIIQEYINQHEYFYNLNASSVNTIRVLTYRSVKSNEIILLQSVLRVGQPGAIVDNQASGGIACGINSKGELNHFAINKSGAIFHEINGLPISEIPPVYKYEELAEYAIDIASKNYYHRLIGFDFCVDYNGKIKLIELNNRNNEINFYQMNNGPLFREYTSEVIKFCSENVKTICFDFEI